METLISSGVGSGGGKILPAHGTHGVRAVETFAGHASLKL
jgi:hypothetical protein